MTQNLSGIEPVKAGRCDDMPLDLSGLAAKADGFASSPDPVVAERFQAVIADGCPAVAESPKALGRAVAELSKAGGCVVLNAPEPGAPRRSEDAPPRQEEFVSQNVAVSQTALNPQVMPVLQNATQPQKDTVPQMAGRAVAELSKAGGCVVLNAPEPGVLRRSEDAPPYQGVTVSQDVAQPQKDAMPQAAERVVPNAPEAKEVGRVVLNAPEPDSEQVQIIAPAPLPIELPAAAVLKQTAPAAPAEVTRMFVAAAEAVADAVLVSSGFVNGEGRMVVRLQPEVLNGSEVQIVAKGGSLTVVVNPATQDVQTIVEANRTQFEQHLAEKVHSWRVSVAVRRGVKTDERV